MTTSRRVTAAVRIPAKAPRIRVASKLERTYKNVVYHSAAEAKQAAELDLLQRVGEIVEWERQVALPIKLRGIFICAVVIDFKVYRFNADPYFLEVKGHETELYRIKRKLLQACYPGIDYRVVKA